MSTAIKRLTIRFTESEWDVLDRAAGRSKVATYAREELLGKAAEKRQPSRRVQPDTELLAQILAALGSSDLSKNMREIADAASTGTLPQSQDMLLNLRAACLAIEKMRFDLIEALGVKPE